MVEFAHIKLTGCKFITSNLEVPNSEVLKKGLIRYKTTQVIKPVIKPETVVLPFLWKVNASVNTTKSMILQCQTCLALPVPENTKRTKTTLMH